MSEDMAARLRREAGDMIKQADAIDLQERRTGAISIRHGDVLHFENTDAGFEQFWVVRYDRTVAARHASVHIDMEQTRLSSGETTP